MSQPTHEARRPHPKGGNEHLQIIRCQQSGSSDHETGAEGTPLDNIPVAGVLVEVFHATGGGVAS